jgi:alpha-beta hydrolase superfamily lysophospholipase
LLHKLIFVNLNKNFRSEGKTGMEWLSDSKISNDKFLTDPLRGPSFSISGFRSLIGSVQSACSLKIIKATNHRLPILIISGDQDPVGKFTNGVHKFEKKLITQNFSNVTKKFYTDHRHEIHNGTAKEKVYTDIGKWINKNI